MNRRAIHVKEMAAWLIRGEGRVGEENGGEGDGEGSGGGGREVGEQLLVGRARVGFRLSSGARGAGGCRGLGVV